MMETRRCRRLGMVKAEVEKGGGGKWKGWWEGEVGVKSPEEGAWVGI